MLGSRCLEKNSCDRAPLAVSDAACLVGNEAHRLLELGLILSCAMGMFAANASPQWDHVDALRIGIACLCYGTATRRSIVKLHGQLHRQLSRLEFLRLILVPSVWVAILSYGTKALPVSVFAVGIWWGALLTASLFFGVITNPYKATKGIRI